MKLYTIYFIIMELNGAYYVLLWYLLRFIVIECVQISSLSGNSLARNKFGALNKQNAYPVKRTVPNPVEYSGDLSASFGNSLLSSSNLVPVHHRRRLAGHFEANRKNSPIEDTLNLKTETVKKRNLYSGYNKEEEPYGVVFSHGKAIGILKPLSQSFELSSFEEDSNPFQSQDLSTLNSPVKRELSQDETEGQLETESHAKYANERYPEILANFKIGHKLQMLRNRQGHKRADNPFLKSLSAVQLEDKVGRRDDKIERGEALRGDTVRGDTVRGDTVRGDTLREVVLKGESKTGRPDSIHKRSFGESFTEDLMSLHDSANNMDNIEDGIRGVMGELGLDTQENQEASKDKRSISNESADIQLKDKRSTSDEDLSGKITTNEELKDKRSISDEDLVETKKVVVQDEDMELGDNKITLRKDTHEGLKRQKKEDNSSSVDLKEVNATTAKISKREVSSKSPVRDLQEEAALNGQIAFREVPEKKEGDDARKESEVYSRNKRQEKADTTDIVRGLESSGELTVSGNKSPLASSSNEHEIGIRETVDANTTSPTAKAKRESQQEEAYGEDNQSSNQEAGEGSKQETEQDVKQRARQVKDKQIEDNLQKKIYAIKEQVKREHNSMKYGEDFYRKKREVEHKPDRQSSLVNKDQQNSLQKNMVQQTGDQQNLVEKKMESTLIEEEKVAVGPDFNSEAALAPHYRSKRMLEKDFGTGAHRVVVENSKFSKRSQIPENRNIGNMKISENMNIPENMKIAENMKMAENRKLVKNKKIVEKRNVLKKDNFFERSHVHKRDISQNVAETSAANSESKYIDCPGGNDISKNAEKNSILKNSGALKSSDPLKSSDFLKVSETSKASDTMPKRYLQKNIFERASKDKDKSSNDEASKDAKVANSVSPNFEEKREVSSSASPLGVSDSISGSSVSGSLPSGSSSEVQSQVNKEDKSKACPGGNDKRSIAAELVSDMRKQRSVENKNSNENRVDTPMVAGTVEEESMSNMAAGKRRRRAPEHQNKYRHSYKQVQPMWNSRRKRESALMPDGNLAYLPFRSENDEVDEEGDEFDDDGFDDRTQVRRRRDDYAQQEYYGAPNRKVAENYADRSQRSAENDADRSQRSDGNYADRSQRSAQNYGDRSQRSFEDYEGFNDDYGEGDNLQKEYYPRNLVKRDSMASQRESLVNQRDSLANSYEDSDSDSDYHYNNPNSYASRRKRQAFEDDGALENDKSMETNQVVQDNTAALHSGAHAEQYHARERERMQNPGWRSFRRKRLGKSVGNAESKLEKVEGMEGLADSDIFGGLPQSYEGELSRFKRVKRSDMEEGSDNMNDTRSSNLTEGGKREEHGSNLIEGDREEGSKKIEISGEVMKNDKVEKESTEKNATMKENRKDEEKIVTVKVNDNMKDNSSSTDNINITENAT